MSKQTAVEEWLEVTKKKNLSIKELKNEILQMPQNLYNKLEGHNYENMAEILFHKWNTPTEWIPQRGERVLVWDYYENRAQELIFLFKIEGAAFPIRAVAESDEHKFLNNQPFHTIGYKNMKQIPKEETKEERMYSDMQEYAEFCIICDRKKMPLLLVQDWYKHYKK